MKENLLTKDSLSEIFSLREEFMNALIKKIPDYYQKWPVDVSTKQSQTALRDLITRGVEEIFEALQHPKNSKPHRETEITTFEKDEFLEEMVDAQNYFFSTLILLGVTPQEFFEAYKNKHNKIMDRLKDGY